MTEKRITIFPSDDEEGASFEPSPLSAQVNDTVFWNNTTGETHQPWPWPPDSNVEIPRATARYLSDPIPPGQTSRPTFVITQPGLLKYYCKTHPERSWETGQISAQKQAFANKPPQTTPDL